MGGSDQGLGVDYKLVISSQSREEAQNFSISQGDPGAACQMIAPGTPLSRPSPIAELAEVAMPDAQSDGKHAKTGAKGGRR